MAVRAVRGQKVLYVGETVIPYLEEAFPGLAWSASGLLMILRGQGLQTP